MAMEKFFETIVPLRLPPGIPPRALSDEFKAGGYLSQSPGEPG